MAMFDGSGTQTISGNCTILFHILLLECNTVELTGSTTISVNGSLTVSPGTALNVGETGKCLVKGHQP